MFKSREPKPICSCDFVLHIFSCVPVAVADNFSGQQDMTELELANRTDNKSLLDYSERWGRRGQSAD